MLYFVLLPLNSNLAWKEGNAGSSDSALTLPTEYNELAIWFKCNNNNAFNQIYYVPTKHFLNEGNNYITVGDAAHWLYVGFSINRGTNTLTCNDVLLAGSVSTCTVYIWYR